MAAIIHYSIQENPIDAHTARDGEIEAAGTLADLFDTLKKAKILQGSKEQFSVFSIRRGILLKNWAEPINKYDRYSFAPIIKGPLAIIGLVFTVASVGFSIYSYVDMRNALKDSIVQDPTKKQNAESQAYTFTGKSNIQDDNTPISVLYGKAKLGGVVINRLVWVPEGTYHEKMKVLISLGEGPFSSIAPEDEESILLDDTNLGNFQNYKYEVQYGGV